MKKIINHKILHIGGSFNFVPQLAEFIKEYFDFEEHEFILMGGMANHLLGGYKNVYLGKKGKIGSLKCLFLSFFKMQSADKIILHGLFNPYLVFVLYLNPWLLKKCYWAMWGGDFYFPEEQSKIQHKVIKKIGYLITSIRGDYELVQKWYGAEGKCLECFMYPSNLYKDYEIQEKKYTTIDIQLGNSADPTNNHIEVLEELVKYKNKDIRIFVPLSYGDKNYAKVVIKKGNALFGDKFIPITEFMSSEKYLEFLSNIDIAIFAHKRQQAMGNTITLLGLGKKVYMRNDVTPWAFFKDLDVKVYDIKNIEIDPIDEKMGKENKERIKEYFSVYNLRRQLAVIFTPAV